MEDASALLEHHIPDVVATAALPADLAAEIDFLAGRVDRWTDRSAHSRAAISARSLALLGREGDAREALTLVDVEAVDVADVAAAAWAASRVGGPTMSMLLARLEAETSEFLGNGIPLGPRRMYVGLLHAARGDLGSAIMELTAAVASGDSRAPVWGARCRLELGRVLRTAEAIPVADTPSAAPVLTAARTFFAAGGYRSLLGRVEEAAAAVPAVLENGRLGRVGFGVQPAVEIRSSKGLTAIIHLIANGHRVVTAAELARVVDGGDAQSIAELTPEAWMLGETEVDAADMGTSDRIRRLFFDDTTRSRVTKLVRRTISKISESHRLLGAHLAASVVTGHGCRYRPTGAPVRWESGGSPLG